MKFIFMNRSNQLGGIEGFIIETSNYLAENGYDVTIIAHGRESIYDKVNINENVNIIRYISNIDVNKCSSIDLLKLRKFFDKNICLDGDIYVIAPFFLEIQNAMYLFNNKDNVKIIHLWGHPEDWKRTLTMNNKKIQFNSKRIKNNLYYYQQNLLKELSNKNAHYYGAEVVPVYNSWYYNVDLKYDKDINLFPIDEIDLNIVKKNNIITGDKIKVVWCGRFDYFKNEAIINIWSTLEKLSDEYNFKFQYDIIGYGDKENTQYVKNKIVPNKVEVNYCGKCDLEKLPEMLTRYNIGVGMGLSVKKMGQVGLPSIVIDSVDKNNLQYLKCAWLFDTKNGDAGDGYYFIQTGKEIKNRKPLYDLILEIIKEKKFNEYSYLSRKYVEDNYSQDKQIKKMIIDLKNSQFTGSLGEIYRYSIIIRFLYKGKNILEKLLFKINKFMKHSK